jgi:hypothetical protein
MCPACSTGTLWPRCHPGGSLTVAGYMWSRRKLPPSTGRASCRGGQPAAGPPRLACIGCFTLLCAPAAYGDAYWLNPPRGLNHGAGPGCQPGACWYSLATKPLLTAAEDECGRTRSRLWQRRVRIPLLLWLLQQLPQGSRRCHGYGSCCNPQIFCHPGRGPAGPSADGLAICRNRLMPREGNARLQRVRGATVPA